MFLDELDYTLPPDLIAQTPAQPRDASRLLVCRRREAGHEAPAEEPAARLEDRIFRDLPAFLRPGDVLVRNDTRVLAARTHFVRSTGGKLELLFLHAGERRERPPESGTADAGPDSPADRAATAAQAVCAGVPVVETWEVLIRGRPRVGETLTNTVDATWTVEVLERFGDGRWLVESPGDTPVPVRLAACGEAPLPPYIRTRLDDPERYQTTFARRPGSAAAPTAGLHFTAELDRRLADAGVKVVEITLHVGLGTFKPLVEERVEANRLHAETYEVPAGTWREVMRAHAEGRRVIAVGTTAVRTLEHLAGLRPPVQATADEVLCGKTELFITPGYAFRIVDAIVSNFHLPRTSLLALVMAFAGVDEIRAAYRHALGAGYRFYSFGDAMLIL
jgi:S-adenosylmethionine:tRNA ribosyltransferase-isomerase